MRKLAITAVCAFFGLLLAKLSAQQIAPKPHVIPVGDAGVGLLVTLPPGFTMEQPQGSYYYFGRAVGGAGAEIWIYVFVDSKRITEETLKQAVTPIQRDTVTMQSRPVEWLSWASQNGHIFHREVYLEAIPRLVHDDFKAKRLEGMVVTISIGGLNESTVSTIQNCFVEAELQEATLPPTTPKSRYRFVEAYYRLPPGYFAGESYEFRGRRFICRHFSDVGSPPSEKGTYQLDGTRLTLHFDKPKFQPVVFYYCVVDGVRLLLTPKSFQTFQSHRRLTPEVYISVPNTKPVDRDWWQKTLKQHPKFGSLISEQQ